MLINDLFLSDDVRDLLVSEMLEHEDQCEQYSEKELTTIEYHWRSMPTVQLLLEYQNYFGSN
jgi:hypothetical protein